MRKLWTSSFIKLTMGLFLLFTAFYMLYPTIPLFILNIGGNESQAGIVMGAFMLSSVLFRPFIGGLVDRYGRRVFLIPGIVLFALSMISYQWISGIFALVLIRMIHGLSWGMSTTSFLTSVTDIIPANRRGEGLGWASMAMTIAMAIGPMIGIWLVEVYSFSSMFVIGFILSILCLILVSWTPNSYQQKVGNNPFKLYDKSLLTSNLTTFFFFFSYGAITTYIPMYALSTGVNSGTFFMIFACTLIISRPVSGKLADKYGYHKVIIPAMLVTIIALLVLGTLSGAIGMILSAILYGIGFGSTQPALQATTINLVPSSRIGVANATFGTASDLGIGLGALVLGLVFLFTSYQGLFIISSFSVAIAFMIFNMFVKKRLLRKLQNQVA